ncbi:MAG: STE24 endopeptidase [Verrucomicrobiales bacterium]|jgi:STE24 endopeptidase
MDYNLYFAIIIVAVVALYHLDLFAELLNLKALKPELPKEFADSFDAEKYEQSQEYTRDGTRFHVISATFNLVVFLVFWIMGGFGWLDEIVRGWSSNEVVCGLYYVALLYAASMVLSLPFDLYDTFVIEEKYGFNKTTLKTFILDRIKGVILGVIIGAPILALIFWVFGKFDNAWLYAWISMTAISLALTYVGPKYIFPIFNKFKPLEDGELKDSINQMADKCEFPLTEVSVIDGSRRSTKANAFFAGFGKNKKIALYDTLIEKQSTRELVAVLAHEIGHFKKKHIVQGIGLGILEIGVIFFLMGLFMNNEGLAAAFGVEKVSVYTSLVFFFMLFKPIEKVLSVGKSILSRKNEFEADAYASDVTGEPQALMSALKKLSADSLSNLTPHPFYVFMHYSHPPMLERLSALEKLVTPPIKA